MNINPAKEISSKREKNINTLKLPQIGNKVPPHSTEAELAVLGALMIDSKSLPKVVEILEEDSFYNPQHRLIYSTILSMFSANRTVDIITLSDELQKRGLLEKAGGTYFLTEINANTPTSANVEQHAYIIQEKYLKRKLIGIAGEIIERNYDDTSDALDNIDIAEKQIFEIAERRFKKGASSIKDHAKKTYELIAKLAERGTGGLTGVPSGFDDLDKKTGGFQNSDLIIIAGRPSMGKTAFGLSICRNTAVRFNRPVAFFSIEMAAPQLVIRLLSSEAKINQQNIRTGMIKEDDHGRIVDALGKLSNAPLFIDDTPMLTVMELRAKCRRLKAEHKISMVMVDYLQLIHAAKAESREREISMISQTLKQIAKELEIPVIALAQLNRGIESRTDKRPMLSDLRESGSIEQDADVVMFVNRPEVYKQMKYEDGNPTEGTGEIIIGKQRNGPIGTVRVAFHKNYARFDNLAYNIEEPPEKYFGDNNPKF